MASIAVLMALIGLISYLSWNSFKQSVLGEGSVNPWSLTFNDFNLLDKIFAIPSTFLALNGSGVEYYHGAFQEVSMELRLYGSPLFYPGHECGRIAEGAEEYIALYSPFSFFEVRCHSTDWLQSLSSFTFLVQALIPVLSIIALFFFVKFVFARLRNGEGYDLLFLQLSMAPYLLVGGAISRYGLGLVLLNMIISYEPLSREIKKLRGKTWRDKTP